MKIGQFKNLPPATQACITWQQGVLVAYRSAGDCYMCLYRLYNFYVEVNYNCCYDGISSLAVLEEEDALSAYLDQIDISELLKVC